MILFADEGELVEKYRRLTDEGRARISSQIECELRIDAELLLSAMKSNAGEYMRQKSWHTFRTPQEELPCKSGHRIYTVEGTGHYSR